MKEARHPELLKAVVALVCFIFLLHVRSAFVALQPRPVALHLAERQWRSWDSATWDQVLFGPIPGRLRKQAAEQLAMLNESPISAEVARHVCRRAGPIDSVQALSLAGNAQVISSLAEIDTDVVVTLLERVLDGASGDALRAIEGDARRHLVWALEKVAFVQKTFERGALLLFELALAATSSASGCGFGHCGRRAATPQLAFARWRAKACAWGRYPL